MKLHFGNLAKTVTESDLKALVTPFGEPSSLEIIKDQSGASKGFAFIEFADDNHAKAAMTGLDGKDVSGSVIKVGEARPRKTGGASRAAFGKKD